MNFTVTFKLASDTSIMPTASYSFELEEGESFADAGKQAIARFRREHGPNALFDHVIAFDRDA